MVQFAVIKVKRTIKARPSYKLANDLGPKLLNMISSERRNYIFLANLRKGFIDRQPTVLRKCGRL